MATLTLNTAARGLEQFSGASKVRTKLVDGTMFIRPTDRKSRVNLPKNEQLVDIAGGKISIEALDHAEGSYSLKADRYGWFGLVPNHTGRTAAVKISA